VQAVSSLHVVVEDMSSLGGSPWLALSHDDVVGASLLDLRYNL
jgi:hypothetical protein